MTLRFVSFLPLLFVMALAACSGQVAVPQITVEKPAGMTPIKGHYAAMVQSGGWALKVETKGMECSIWDFDTDINESYAKAMQDTLKNAVERITFIPDTLSPGELKSKGYGAQIVVYQGGVDSAVNVISGFFSATAHSEIVLSTIVAITDPSGLKKQYSVTGRGKGDEDVFVCNTIGEAIVKASQSAILDLTKSTALHVRDGLRD